MSEDKDTEKEKLKQERDEYLNGWKRAKADLINYKKEELGRLEEVGRFAKAEVMRDILSVLDSFELAISALEKKGGVEKGVYMIKGQLDDVLVKHGLRRLETKEGDPFDPSLHDAVASVETEEDRDDRVAEVVERGYVLHDRVLRPARVKVYKRKK